jgi:phosphoenolpyruvate-protein kinase (PTS system EI component)
VNPIAEPVVLEGDGVVEGIAIGAAIVWADDPPPRAQAGAVEHEVARLEHATARAKSGIAELLRLLPRAEAELFEPEAAILDDLGPRLVQRVAEGVTPEDAVREATAAVPTDLLVDVRARLLDGLASGDRSVESLLEGRDGDRVLVTHSLTPSVVAALPARVVGIVAAAEDVAPHRPGYTSHAAILARGRDIVLAFVASDRISAIGRDDTVVVDTTGERARVWVRPNDELVLGARGRRDAWLRARSEEETKVTEPLAHLGVGVHVNIGLLHEHVPPSADGVGLVRTELLFSDHATAPSEAEQFWALRALAAQAGTMPIVVRLFDAGGDKLVSWLPAPDPARSRGIELLLSHPGILDSQLRALVRAAERADLRALVPMVTRPVHLERVRARITGKLAIGAMIETPGAVAQVDGIVGAADFVCIGTNDLTATVTGEDRANSTLSLDPRVLRMVEHVAVRAHAQGRKVTVCGELAGDPHCARIFIGLGVDGISVAPGRFARVKLSLRELTLADCERVARAALG